MGIINVTKESFSDGGCYIKPEEAIEHGIALMQDGADILDIGGVSTAPHVAMISEQEELDRIAPVIEGLIKAGIFSLSIDTMRASVAAHALKLGASWINDQSAGCFDDGMPAVMAKADAVVIMHNGGGKTSGVIAGEAITYGDVLEDIKGNMEQRISALAARGVKPSNIIVDPGFGFGKGVADSLALINALSTLDVAAMVLVGLSRKSFIGALSNIKCPKERDTASLGASAIAALSGAHIMRVHNVKAHHEFFKVWDACRKMHK